MSWSHPELGRIEAMHRRNQAEHVWRHLYNPAERWEDLAPLDPRVLAQEATAAGCPPFNATKAHPPFRRPVQRLLQVHHDRAYGPAYTAELEAEGTRWAVKLADPSRWVARTPAAVIVVVGRNAPCRVVTAYRPLPPLRLVVWTEADFSAQADYVFEKETGMAADPTTRLARELLRVAQAGAGTPRDAWWLALAIGRARATVALDPGIREPLERAEVALAAGIEVTRQRILGTLSSDDMLDRLAVGLKDEDPGAAELALSDLEDALLVLETLELDAAAEGLLGRASDLLAWLPAGFSVLGAQAVLRRRALGDRGAAVALCSAVEEGLLGAQLRASEPAWRPAASLVDSLLPIPGLRDRVADLARRGAATIRSMLDQQLATFEVRVPAPVMGQDMARGRPWSLVGQVSPSGGWLRAFVVDAKHPEGYDVTDQAQAPGVSIWEFEQPGQEALVVLVTAAAELPGDGLASVLDAAEARPDVVVAIRRFSRPR
ncbi:hypothetical protein L6R53_20050 [Myxococcota bacterium]|nr:hypothetical protein [Myxococcota bacterium]